MKIEIEMKDEEVEEYVELKRHTYGNSKTVMRIVEIEASILNKVFAGCYYETGEQK